MSQKDLIRRDTLSELWPECERKRARREAGRSVNIEILSTALLRVLIDQPVLHHGDGHVWGSFAGTAICAASDP